ncbi:phosphatidic acid phosphatase type 2/haloperoxidase [Suillus bovinus]|uniref:phosphatidic acid phosphatase type 2/haloperoxidase n=1 Tax=Suillus bovinus TaxID=48563 RepID=UPI001B878EE1|nr:phosphatidic acid phosphatase type 2/haloperoxidase [Suillus bovinus]KAG2127920.1 phosphatidic acid phosphatase type 2/haloperoxidase [Suillus bovinus]
MYHVDNKYIQAPMKQRTDYYTSSATLTSTLESNPVIPNAMSQEHQRLRPSLRRFMLSYAPDWIISGALWAIFWAIDNYIRVSGFKRQFSLSDVSLRYPYAVNERVGTTALSFISCGIPFVVQCFVNFLTVQSWWDFHHSTLGLVLSLSTTRAITQLVKVTVGRPRPDLISRCQPVTGSADPLFGLSTVDICTQTVSKILEDGWKSFPSGHSSMSFAGLGFLAFYLIGKLHLFDTRGYVSKVWICIAPLAGAMLVAISRTMDYRHHWQDVVGGSTLGLLLAYFSYRQYYPHLALAESHQPYTTRFEDTKSVEFGGISGTTEPLLNSYDEDDEVISTRRHPRTGIRR